MIVPSLLKELQRFNVEPSQVELKVGMTESLEPRPSRPWARGKAGESICFVRAVLRLNSHADTPTLNPKPYKP